MRHHLGTPHVVLLTLLLMAGVIFAGAFAGSTLIEGEILAPLGDPQSAADSWSASELA